MSGATALSMALSGFRFSTSIFAKLYPHHSLPPEEIINQFSSCGPAWSQSKVRAIDWHPHALKLVSDNRAAMQSWSSLLFLQLPNNTHDRIHCAVGCGVDGRCAARFLRRIRLGKDAGSDFEASAPKERVLRKVAPACRFRFSRRRARWRRLVEGNMII